VKYVNSVGYSYFVFKLQHAFVLVLMNTVFVGINVYFITTMSVSEQTLWFTSGKGQNNIA